MLSAVELHSGGGSGFYPSFNRPPPMSSDPYNATQSQMSGTEFARPKPKNIGNSASLNGLSSSAISPPTHKYSHHLQHEQNGPVNLAVNHHHQQPSRQQASPPDKEQNSDKEIDVVGLGGVSSGNSISFANTSTNSRIPSFPAGLGTNAYQALNYSFYGNRYRLVTNYFLFINFAICPKISDDYLLPVQYPTFFTSFCLSTRESSANLLGRLFAIGRVFSGLRLECLSVCHVSNASVAKLRTSVSLDRAHGTCTAPTKVLKRTISFDVLIDKRTSSASASSVCDERERAEVGGPSINGQR